MTNEELERLAEAIARSLITAYPPPADRRGERTTWVPAPVRPEPPGRGGEAPPWSGAGQRLGDVAPGPAGDPPPHRAAIGELTVAARTAAAGRGAARPVRERAGRTASDRAAGRRRGPAEGSIEVKVGVSNRHVHLAPEHVRALFGVDQLTSERALSQPTQFAARERVDVNGPAGSLQRVRVVGPARSRTQLELSPSDSRILGVEPPLRVSGSLEGSAGGVTLTGPVGSVSLDSGVIIAARHLHLAADDAKRWGLRDGDVLDVRCGTASRAVTLHDVVVRAGPQYATELHVDADEAHAAGIRTGDRALILTWRSAPGGRRALITERDVLAHAREGRAIPQDAILTPSARDRARALRLINE